MAVLRPAALALLAVLPLAPAAAEVPPSMTTQAPTIFVRPPSVSSTPPSISTRPSSMTTTVPSETVAPPSVNAVPPSELGQSQASPDPNRRPGRRLLPWGWDPYW